MHMMLPAALLSTPSPGPCNIIYSTLSHGAQSQPVFLNTTPHLVFLNTTSLREPMNSLQIQSNKGQGGVRCRTADSITRGPAGVVVVGGGGGGEPVSGALFPFFLSALHLSNHRKPVDTDARGSLGCPVAHYLQLGALLPLPAAAHLTRGA